MQFICGVGNAVLVLVWPSIAKLCILDSQAAALVNVFLHKPCSRSECHGLKPACLFFGSAIVRGAFVVHDTEPRDLAVLGAVEDFRIIAGAAVSDRKP